MSAAATTPHSSARQCRRSALGRLQGRACRAVAARGSVRDYLTEAVQHVFQTEEDKTLKWKASGFQGRISHDDHARLRKIYDVVRESKEAAQRRPLLALPAPAEETVTLRQYLQGAIEKVFNTKDSASAEPTWYLTPYDGKISSKREIDRMLHVEKVIQDTMQTADGSKQ